MCPSAIVLLSGGMDSATALAITKADRFDIIALTFDYGQRGVEGDAIEIRTPLIEMTKADIVRRGEALDMPWELTWSCYLGGAKACGVCDACQLRLKGFREAGVKDPLPYAAPRRRTRNA